MRNVCIWVVTTLSCFSIFMFMKFFNATVDKLTWLDGLGWIAAGLFALIITIKSIIETLKQKDNEYF